MATRAAAGVLVQQDPIGTYTTFCADFTEEFGTEKEYVTFDSDILLLKVNTKMVRLAN